MTQRGQGMTTDRQTSAPILKLWPTHAFSTKSFTPGETSTTMFGRNLLTSKRPCGKTSRRRSIVAEVTRWTGAKSKNVPGGAPRAMDSSVTVSLLGRPSISGLLGSASIPRDIRLCYRLCRFRSGRSLLLRRVLGSALGLKLLGVKHSVASKAAIGQGLRVILERIRWRLGAAVNHRKGLVLLHQ